jgi:hypothetical protein
MKDDAKYYNVDSFRSLNRFQYVRGIVDPGTYSELS